MTENNVKVKTKKPIKKKNNNRPNYFPNGRIDLTNMPYGAVEYRMSKVAIDDLLKSRKGAELKMTPQKFLCNYVNTQCGLKYNCVKVTAM